MANRNKTEVVNRKDLVNQAIMKTLQEYALEYGQQELQNLLIQTLSAILTGNLPVQNMGNALPNVQVSNIMRMLGGNIGNVQQLVNNGQRRLGR
jgi:hypothetical protein